MTDVNNWVKERRQIVYPRDAVGRRVRLKYNKVSKLICPNFKLRHGRKI